MMLFYGGRTPGEIAYHDELMGMPAGLLDVNMAYSRVAGKPKQYVQDLLRAKAQQVAAMLRNDDCFIYVCGLKGMENGINEAFRDICRDSGSNWDELVPQLMAKARLHIETY